MPFTPSHAIVALPFARTALVPAAVAVGAMAPDLPMFVPAGLVPSYDLTHDLRMLPLTVLLALALLLLWRCVLRPAARELSPMPVARRLPGEWDAGAGVGWRQTLAIGERGAWSRVTLLVLALALGAASHVVWDLFTHEHRWGVELVPQLATMWGPLLGYKWLQYGSGALGVLVLAVWAWRWSSRRAGIVPVTRVVPGWIRGAWWLSLPVILLVAAVFGAAVKGPFGPGFTVAHLGYQVLLPACGVWALVTVALAIGVQTRRYRA